ncbi:NAD(P)H-quinone oxidoreductase [Pseudidiomarina aestuarii]|uniref:NAD(P)H-quinone oxidoreductase n=2 Tax=Pseudidiomarina aestuarii TaxID=624146 RepID=A0A7Z6ZVY2_9GAMM|nr:NAD(P)H-quinone oxidoreductase [Pseudidiomarina aestuarii]
MQALLAVDKTPQWISRAVPECGIDEVLIRVAYAGLNRADLMQIAGHYPPPVGASDILGLEVSGVVVACGEHVTQVSPGDTVCALLAAGGYADYVAVPAGQVARLPDGLSLAEGAGICEAYATAWWNLYVLAAVQSGERILIHAGASSVGNAAIQLAQAFDNPCFVTVGSDEKLAWCQQLGADAGWNRQRGSFVDAVKAWGGADIILDPVAGDYLAGDLEVIHADGRIIIIGLLAGRFAQVDIGRLLMKRVQLRGSTLRSQSVAVKSNIMAQLQQSVWPLFESKQLQPQLDTVIARTDLMAAFERMQNNDTQGKLVVTIHGD